MILFEDMHYLFIVEDPHATSRCSTWIKSLFLDNIFIFTSSVYHVIYCHTHIHAISFISFFFLLLLLMALYWWVWIYIFIFFSSRLVWLKLSGFRFDDAESATVIEEVESLSSLRLVPFLLRWLLNITLRADEMTSIVGSIV